MRLGLGTFGFTMNRYWVRLSNSYFHGSYRLLNWVHGLSAERGWQNEFGMQSIVHRGLVDFKCDDILKETLDFDDSQLATLYQRTFGPGPMDNYQKFLVA